MMDQISGRRWYLAPIMIALLVAGCGDGRATRVPVSGRVLIDGKPLERGFIQVICAHDRSASGEIGADGKFQLTTYEPNDGCVPGTHQVSIIANESQGPSAMKWFAPKEYADAATSGLTLEVSQARDDVEINLTWAGKAPFVEKFGDEGTQPPPE